MKRIVFCWLLSATWAGALDFNYRWVETRGEGGSYRYLQFRDADRLVTYMPPKTWVLSATRDCLRLMPPEAGGAEIDITIRPLNEPPGMDPADYPAWEKIAREALPPGATEIKVVSIGEGMSVDGRRTCEAILSYSFFGSVILASHLYATRGPELLCFRASCPAGGFERYRTEFQTSLHTFAGS